MLVRIANSESKTQIRLHLRCLSIDFLQATSFRNFRTSNRMLSHHKWFYMKGLKRENKLINV